MSVVVSPKHADLPVQGRPRSRRRTGARRCTAGGAAPDVAPPPATPRRVVGGRESLRHALCPTITTPRPRSSRGPGRFPCRLASHASIKSPQRPPSVMRGDVGPRKRPTSPGTAARPCPRPAARCRVYSHHARARTGWQAGRSPAPTSPRPDETTRASSRQWSRGRRHNRRTYVNATASNDRPQTATPRRARS